MRSPGPALVRRRSLLASARARALVAAAALVAAGLAVSACAARNYLEPVAPTARLDQPAPGLPPPSSLRVVTFNIQHGRRVDEAVAALKTHQDLRDADILLLQEMSGAGVEAIARALSLEFAYYPASNHGGRDNGDAVLSRWPILSSWKVPLPHVARTTGEVRAAVGARLLVGERLFLAYSLHVSSPFALTPTQRGDQVAAVLADAAASGEPAVIGGDLNGWGIGRHLEQAGYTWATRDVGPSLVWFSVDHIFVRGVPASTVRAGVARDVRDASDHRPVWAEIDAGRLNPAEAGSHVP